MRDPLTTADVRRRVEQGLAALSGTWASASDGRILVLTGSKAARQAAINDLRHAFGLGVDVVVLSPDGLFMSLLSHAKWCGVELQTNGEVESLRQIADAYAAAGRHAVFVCDDVARTGLHDLGYLCRGINGNVNDAYDGKPGILLVLLGSDTPTTRRHIYEAWPDSVMGTLWYPLV